MAACQRPIVIATIKVAVVVGTILNFINQGGRGWKACRRPGFMWR